jgi:hypothetical protein
VKQLSDREIAVVKAYVSNGYNKGKAYASVYPDCNTNTSRINGWKMLTQPHVKLAIEAYTDKEAASLKDSKQAIITEAVEITQEARSQKQYSAAMKGLDTRAKLGGYYEQDEESSQKYISFVQQITNNTLINVSDKTDKSISNDEQALVNTHDETTLHAVSNVIDNTNDDDRDNEYMTEVG